MNRIPRWRIAAAVAILAGLVFFLARFAPIYLHNRQLQNFVSAMTQAVESQAKSDDLLRTLVLDKAHELALPVTADNVHILRSPEGYLRHVDVRYSVPVDFPGYTVSLHFYPGAGSR